MKPTRSAVFNSFFMAGYECADHLNCYGNRVNLLHLTHHHEQVLADYRALVALGITTVREGICWSSVEPHAYHYNFKELGMRIAAAQECGIQQVWDLCHFGFPDDLFPNHPHFAERFAALCHAFCLFYRQCTNQPLFVVPINEISFLAWLGGDVRGTVPYSINAGFDVKYHLCKAAIRGIKEIKELEPTATVLTSEPVVHVTTRIKERVEEATRYNEYQYQATDMLIGRMCPELGGQPELVDVIGQNYYSNCQWLTEGGELPWPATEQLRKPLAELLLQTSERYRKPLWLSETSAVGIKRGPWLREVSLQCIEAINRGADVKGICIYPILNRPDWDHPEHMHESGLWNCLPSGERVLEEGYYEVLRDLMLALGLQHALEPQQQPLVESTGTNG